MTNREALRIQQRTELTLFLLNQALDLQQQENPDTMVNPQVADIISKVDAATNAIAARIQALIANVNPPLSAEDTAAFQAEIDKLNALGSDGTVASVPGAGQEDPGQPTAGQPGQQFRRG